MTRRHFICLTAFWWSSPVNAPMLPPTWSGYWSNLPIMPNQQTRFKRVWIWFPNKRCDLTASVWMLPRNSADLACYSELVYRRKPWRLTTYSQVCLRTVLKDAIFYQKLSYISNLFFTSDLYMAAAKNSRNRKVFLLR